RGGGAGAPAKGGPRPGGGPRRAVPGGKGAGGGARGPAAAAGTRHPDPRWARHRGGLPPRHARRRPPRATAPAGPGRPPATVDQVPAVTTATAARRHRSRRQPRGPGPPRPGRVLAGGGAPRAAAIPRPRPSPPYTPPPPTRP